MKEDDIRRREAFNRYLELVRVDAERIFSDKSSFVLIPCPACGSSKSRNEIAKFGFTYVHCEKCETLYVNPRPPFSKLLGFYTESPSTSFWVNEFFLPVAEVRRVRIFRPRAEFVAGRFRDLRSGTIGDIGAGFGIFLEEMKRIWPESNLIAIEPSQEMAKICRSKNLCVIEKPLEVVGRGEQSFDLLTAFELFEHLHDPQAFVQKVHELLTPGGSFLLTALNGLGFDIQVLWEHSKSVSPPHHLNFFNPWSIIPFLERAGFRVIEASTPGELDWDIVESSYTLEGFDIGRFWRTVSAKGSPSAKIKLQRWIIESKFSSHMRIICQKQ